MLKLRWPKTERTEEAKRHRRAKHQTAEWSVGAWGDSHHGVQQVQL